MSHVLDLEAALASPAPPPGADGEALLDAWRDARDDAAQAYAAWTDGPHRRTGERFAVYLAAADREAAAADAFARWAATTTHTPPMPKEPA